MTDTKLTDTTSKTPSYFNPSGVIREPSDTSTPLLNIEPMEENPEEALKRKYPIKVIVGMAILLVTVLAIPVGVYLNQRPTSVFIEATATPTPTPTPTPTSTS